MSIPHCEICNEMIIPTARYPHKCNPRFYAVSECWLIFEYDEDKPVKDQQWDVVEPDEWAIIFARDAERAAEKYVENNYFDLEFPDEEMVIVKDETGKFYRFTVVCEQTVDFNAVPKLFENQE